MKNNESGNQRQPALLKPSFYCVWFVRDIVFKKSRCNKKLFQVKHPCRDEIL